VDRRAILEEWLAAVLATYPGGTARVLRESRDPFRNPAGRVLREGLAAALDAILDDGDPRAALDEVIRLRAVQDFTPSQAVGFVLALRPMLPPDLAPRVDRAALAAFDVFMECREKLCEARVHEARRQLGVLARGR
jgi:hypothetical protein